MKKRLKSPYCFMLILIILTVMVFFAILFKYILFISTIDVEYVSKVEDALKDYDINKLDLCLTNDAEICYKRKEYKYSECRNNILENMKKKNYTISMYGGGNNMFINDIQKINTQVYGSVLNKDYGENNITVYLKKIGINEFKIVKLESNDEIFEQIFLKRN